MKKIALLAPGFLTIPAIDGGAIETLATELIDENEKYNNVQFHVFSYVKRKSLPSNICYRNTIFHFFQENLIIKFWSVFNRLVFKLSRYSIKPRNHLSLMVNAVDRKERFDAIIVDGNHAQIYSIKRKEVVFLYFHIVPRILKSQKSIGILNKLAGLIVISDFAKDFLISAVGLSNDKVTKITNCCDFKSFRFDLESRYLIRKQYGIGDNETVFLFCGRLDEGKGIEDLIDAFIASRTVNSTLMVVGSVFFNRNKDDNFSKRIKGKCSKSTKIVFTGFVEHKKMFQYYSSADVLFSPSKCFEAAGLVNVEAAANGLEIVTSKDGGIPEYVSDFNVRYIDENNRLESLVKYIEEYDSKIFNFADRLVKKNVFSRFDLKLYYERVIECVLQIKNENSSN